MANVREGTNKNNDNSSSNSLAQIMKLSPNIIKLDQET